MSRSAYVEAPKVIVLRALELTDSFPIAAEALILCQKYLVVLNKVFFFLISFFFSFTGDPLRASSVLGFET